MKELKEENLFEFTQYKIKEAYLEIKDFIHEINSTAEEKVKKTMVGFYTEARGLVWFKPTKKSITIWLRKGKYLNKTGKVIPRGWGDYPELYIPADEIDVCFIKKLIDQANHL